MSDDRGYKSTLAGIKVLWKVLSANVHRIRVPSSLLLLCAAAYVPAIFAIWRGAWPFEADALALFAPWRDFARSELRQGTLPLWNPHTFCGMPFIGNGQSAIFYPPNFLYWLLPINIALLLDALLHNVLLACGGYLLARALRLSRTASWLAALILGLGGAVAAHIYYGHMTWHAARAYLPWLLWALLMYLRCGQWRYALALALFFALQIHSGYPPFVLLGLGLCCGLVMAWIITRWLNKSTFILPRGWSMVIPASAALTIVLAAVVALPLYEVNRLAVHGSDLPFSQATELSGSWRSLARLIVPNFFGGNRRLQWSLLYGAHEEAAYIGLLPLILALGALFFARISKIKDQRSKIKMPPAVPWLWALLPIGVVLAMGSNTPLYEWLWDRVALLRLTRIPVRWMELCYFSGALLAAFSFDACIHRASNDESTLRYARTIVIIAWVLAGALAALAAWVMATSPSSLLWMQTAQWNQFAPSQSAQEVARSLRSRAVTDAVLAAALAAGGAVLLTLFVKSNVLWRRRFEKALLAFIVFDLLLLFWRSTMTETRQVFNEFIAWPTSLARRYEPEQRWTTRLDWRALNRGMMHGIDLFNGYDAMSSRRYFEFASIVEGRDFWRDMYQPRRDSPLLRVAGVTHTLVTRFSSPDDRPAGDVQLVAREGRWSLWQHKSTFKEAVWPRVYVTRQVLRVAESDQLRTLEKLAKQAPIQKSFPVVAAPEIFTSVRSSPLTTQDRVLWWRRGTNSIVVEVTISAPAVLVMSEAAYPGWRASVNGQGSAVERVNHLFRGVEVKAGRQRVALVYDSATFRFGLFLSLFGLAVVAALLVSGGARRA